MSHLGPALTFRSPPLPEMADAGAAPVAPSLDESAPAPADMISLIASDGTEFLVRREAAYISVVVKTTLESDKAATSMPIPRASADALKEVVAYMEHHNGKPALVPSPVTPVKIDHIDPWDAAFVGRLFEDRTKLYSFFMTVNYMDIKPLLNLCAAKIALSVRGLPVAEVEGVLDPSKKKKEQPHSSAQPK